LYGIYTNIGTDFKFEIKIHNNKQPRKNIFENINFDKPIEFKKE
jgi:hypothetical protein